MQPLIAGPRLGLDPAEVAEVLAYAAGGHFRHGVDLLDLAGNKTGERLPFVSGSVNYAYRPPSMTSGQEGGVADTRVRGSFELAGPLQVNLAARRLLPFTEVLLRSGAWARFDHAVLEPLNPSIADDGVLQKRVLSCRDKSARWAAKQLGAPRTVSGSTQVVPLVRQVLTDVFGETRFAITSSEATLVQGKTWEGDTSYLTFLSELLGGIAYDALTVDEQGRPASQPLSVLAGRGAEATYGAGAGKIVPDGSVTPLLPSLPNVLIFSARQGPSLGNAVGNGLTIRRNETTGPASILSRGGGVQAEVEEYISTDVASQTALEAFADAEQQRYFAGGGLRFSGRIALNPRAGDRDLLEIRKPRLGMTEGVWQVTSWDLPMSDLSSEDGALMRITAERRVG